MVADEPQRVGERVEIGVVGENHRAVLDHGTSIAPEGDEPRVACDRERDGERARRVDLRLERRRLLEREEDRVAEPLRQQERRDRRDRDRRHDRDAQAADDQRHGERQLDARQDLPLRQSHAARCLEHVGRRALEAGEDVGEEDHERVRDERDLDRGRRDARERDEDLEEREARDRVEERRDDPDRLLDVADAVCDQRQHEGNREPDRDRDRRQLEVLDERRPERVVPVLADPVGAERVVTLDA